MQARDCNSAGTLYIENGLPEAEFITDLLCCAFSSVLYMYNVVLLFLLIPQFVACHENMCPPAGTNWSFFF